MKLRYGACALGLLAGLFPAWDAPVLAKEKGPCAALKALDPDNDGTLDLNEAKEAATKLFDGTLTAKELQGRLSRKELAAGDPDKDATLTKDEYLAIVESRFKDANADTDGTIDCKEASGKAGRALMRLLK
jgi:hypothetical protein